MELTQVNRVAIFSGAELLGDGLFKLPFIRGLRATFPHAEIIWVTSGATVYADALKDLVAPYLSRVAAKTGIGASSAEIFIRKQTDIGAVDIAIDTQTVVWRSLAVRHALKPRLFIAAAADYLLSGVRPRDIDKGWTKNKPTHFVDHLMRLTDLAAGGHAVVDPAAIVIPKQFTELASHLLPEGRRYVGFAPGSGDPTKRWPLDRFLQLGRETASKGYTPVFFVGPGERCMLETIRDGVPDALFPEENLSDNAPKGPLLVAALGQRLDAALANDSGLGHMLAIADIPLVLLYGRHSPEKYAPRTPRLKTLWAQNFGGPDHELIPRDAAATALWAALEKPGY